MTEPTLRGECITCGRCSILNNDHVCHSCEKIGMSNRISVDEYYLRIAHTAALRSTCSRAKVGCVIVKDTHTFMGYNGSLPGYPHCDRSSCIFEGRCIMTSHAEVNAIKRAIDAGINVKGATIYCTHRPCYSCSKDLALFGIMDIVFDQIYEDERAVAYHNLVKMSVRQVRL